MGLSFLQLKFAEILRWMASSKSVMSFPRGSRYLPEGPDTKYMRFPVPTARRFMDVEPASHARKRRLKQTMLGIGIWTMKRLEAILATCIFMFDLEGKECDDGGVVAV